MLHEYVPLPDEDLAQAMVALRSLCGHEGQIGGHKDPFVITDITGIGLACHLTGPHWQMLEVSYCQCSISETKVHNTL